MVRLLLLQLRLRLQMFRDYTGREGGLRPRWHPVHMLMLQLRVLAVGIMAVRMMSVPGVGVGGEIVLLLMAVPGRSGSVGLGGSIETTIRPVLLLLLMWLWNHVGGRRRATGMVRGSHPHGGGRGRVCDHHPNQSTPSPPPAAAVRISRRMYSRTVPI